MNRVDTALRLLSIFLLVAISGSMQRSNSQESKAPPLAPAEYTWNGTQFELRYDGNVLFRARLENPEMLEGFNTVVSHNDGKIDQVFKWVSRKNALRLTGTVTASEESFPASLSAWKMHLSSSGTAMGKATAC